MTTDTGRPAVARVGTIVPRTRAEGPGTRFAIWAQGCSVRCPGCFNPHLWGTSGGTDRLVDDLVALVLAEADAGAVEGITLLGGEPFDQAKAFAQLGAQVREANLSVMTFTGHERAWLESPAAPPGAAALLSVTDLLVDGAYRADQPDHVRPWVGSRNQELHFLTDRYAGLRLAATPDRLEMRISADGGVTVNGWAGVDQLDALLEGIGPPVGRGTVR